ncbi:neurogenic locus notch homolog protein 1-like [Stegodyphus dumicola]|uniref:neurogenic locus notch homolog protein 1-like n=1 Tax=Stegodyphus dumicola TaxID=202533 RepID=UPI0015A9ACBA|nr:neurogenic locus notch homolog protein 1-like [Stegodyphus dumicola]
MNRECTKANANCVFDKASSKASCVCKDQAKVYNGKTCVDKLKPRCNYDYECHYGGKCVGNVCHCRKGMSGGKCEEINECQTLKEICEKGNAVCSYDVEEEKAFCQCEEGKSYDGMTGKCKDCRCMKNAKCTFDGNGEPFCRCIKGFKYFEGQCKECDCGPHGICAFRWDGVKLCKCHGGYADFEKKCKECICGPNERCYFGIGGEQKCGCVEGFSVFKGKCLECSCGTNGTCYFDEDGRKQCKCDPRYVEYEGQCICGEGYVEYEGECRERCSDDSYCKNGGQCTDGFCKCREGTKGDRCEILTRCTEELNRECAKANAKCIFDKASSKVSCVCIDQAKVYNGKTCVEKCQTSSDCLHGGTCIDNVCLCKNGTSGSRCEIVEECERRGHICEEANAICLYDIEEEEVYCKCKEEGKTYDILTERCREFCIDDSHCANGGKCSRGFCRCKAGTEGDKCTIVTGCTDDFVSKCTAADATCVFDETAKNKASCKCRNAKLSFNGERCAESCRDDSDCENKGQCVNGFCKCKDGTEGDKCEIVTGCTDELRKKCTGIDAVCTFDETSANKATCVCKDSFLLYNGEKCVEPCSDSSDCANGGECVNKFCKCRDGTAGDKCTIVTGCTEELAAKCSEADATCVYDDTAENKASCICKNPKLFYNGEKCAERCEKRTDCKNQGECVKGFCKCKDGTQGDKCEIVTGCTDELRKKCNGIDAVCTFDETSANKATCVCKNSFLLYNGEKCVEPCSDSSDCANGGECMNKFCKCRDGTAGDKCTIVTGCTDELATKCSAVDAMCVYDDKAENKASCVCKNPKLFYNGEKCAERCEKRTDCKNQGECVKGFCKCKDGTQGDKCEIVTGCTDELRKKCNGIDAVCTFDETSANKATCVCKNSFLLYDGEKCVEPCSDSSDCANGGECVNKFCKCRDGTAGDKCTIVTGCTDELAAKCSAVDAMCVYDDKAENKASCVCKNPKLFYNGEKCAERCEKRTDCKNQGECISGFCKCKDGTNGDKCEIVTGCTDELKRKCANADADCIFDETSVNKATCVCRNNLLRYNGETCVETCTDRTDCENQGECVNGFCKCKDGTKGDKCEIVTGCTVELKKKCARADAVCTYDETSVNKVTCTCRNDLLRFDGEKCIEPCRDRTDCKNDGECRNGFCKCKDGTEGDKCEIVTGCKDELEEKCATAGAICTFDETSPNKATCTCINDLQRFNGEKCVELCRDNSDCANGGECVNRFCKCKDGTEGDKCTTVTGCTDEMISKCTATDATCVYDETAVNKASCVCRNPNLSFNGKKCAERCGEDADCENNGQCRNGFCKCKDGTEGDKCEIVTGCTDELKRKCTFADADCKYDETSEEKAICMCRKKSMRFNGEKCIDLIKPRCKNDNNCHNGGKCVGNVCHCRKGTSGGRCEDIDDCQTLKQICEQGNAICSYDIEEEKAFCECEEGKSFDSVTRKCRDCRCGRNAKCFFDRNGEPFCRCIKGFKNFEGECKECDCGPYGMCVFGWDGVKQCSCHEGYMDWEKKCKECNCGPHGMCYFGFEGEKKCSCDEGYSVFEGKCLECSCGSNGTCYFDEDGQKQCNCDQGYVEYQGQCEECNCGQSGTCSFDAYKQKKCDCYSRFKEFEGECLECYCGAYGTCTFTSNGGKQCTCNEGFKEFDGRCKECDCGVDGTCSFGWDGEKHCNCSKGFRDYEGECRECDCGQNGACFFDLEGRRQCKCEDGFKEYLGKCKECDCGLGATCYFNQYGGKYCLCNVGYEEFNEKCIECDCGPYSNCSLNAHGKKMCSCSEGYRELNGKCKECSCGENGACSFDRSGYKLCMCGNGFKEHSGICRECYCGSNSSCVFNNFGNKECICQDDYVEFKGLCKECICGPNSICAFDKYGRKRCACKTGFAKFEGECHECNCGQNSACSFGYYGDKQCDCGQGFVAFDGKCRECECGGNSTCMFDKYGNKKCFCGDEFAEFGGYCRECSCGRNSKCQFDKYGNQQCTCKEGFAKFNGACKECNCGNKSNCAFSYYGVKQCICTDGYVEYEGKCRDCYCGPNSTCVIDRTKGKKCLCGYGLSEFGGLCRECNCGRNSTCSLDPYGQKKCTCQEGFVQVLGMCRDACDNYPCKNGKCVRIPRKGATCQCESNYKGTFCDIPVETNFEIKKETLVFIVTIFGGILLTILMILCLIACLLCRRNRSGHTEIHESHWNYKIHRCPN